MADIRDYLEMRGDITLAERSFNDVDNLILSTLAYLDLTGIVPAPGERGDVSVTEACARLLELVSDVPGGLASRVRSLATVDERFVRALGASERLGSARLRDYVDVRDGDRVMQFSAVTADLPTCESYVAFRGTDTTLVGWRENFILSFDVTEAQRAAASYLSHEVEGLVARGRRVRVGGHSKGGNLASYATTHCPVALHGAIVCVYNNDGPGIDRTVQPVTCRDVMGERYRGIVPAYSVVGRFFSDDEPDVIVRSSASRALQHDPLSWQVGRSAFVGAPCADPESLVVSGAFSAWLSRLGAKDRALLTNELFDALAAGGATTFDDLFSTVGGAQRVLAALGGVDPRTAEMMRGLIGELVGSTAAATRDAVAVAAAEAASRAGAAIAGLVGRGAGDKDVPVGDAAGAGGGRAAGAGITGSAVAAPGPAVSSGDR